MFNLLKVSCPAAFNIHVFYTQWGSIITYVNKRLCFIKPALRQSKVFIKQRD